MELKLPNLGENVSESTIITLHLEKGKNIQKDDIILELETDKATLEIPSPNCGIVKEVLVKVGDSIKQGHVVAILEENSSEPAKEDPVKEEAEAEAEIPKTEPTETKPIDKPEKSAAEKKQLIILKDLGEGIEEANILKIAVKKGDEIKEGTILIELETDKSTIEIPSDFAGKVESIAIKEGDKIKIGQKILTLSISLSEIAETNKKNPHSKPADILVPAFCDPSGNVLAALEIEVLPDWSNFLA